MPSTGVPSLLFHVTTLRLAEREVANLRIDVGELPRRRERQIAHVDVGRRVRRVHRERDGAVRRSTATRSAQQQLVDDARQLAARDVVRVHRVVRALARREQNALAVGASTAACRPRRRPWRRRRPSSRRRRRRTASDGCCRSARRRCCRRAPCALCGSVVYASVLPSGDHAGVRPARRTSSRSSRRAGRRRSTTYASVRVSRSSVVGDAAKASACPSGDQVGAPFTVKLPCTTSVARLRRDVDDPRVREPEVRPRTPADRRAARAWLRRSWAACRRRGTRCACRPSTTRSR